MMRCLNGWIFIVMIFMSTKVFSQSTSPADTFPVPKNNPYQLFYLQRQPNTNTIVVDLNVENGKVNNEHPVIVYWRRYQEDGRKAKLNFIQKEFAYGIQSKKIADGKYELNFVSYKKMKFRLERGANNIWQVFSTLSNGSRMILRRIYLHVNGGSFWKPHIEYVELKGSEAGTHKEIRERIFLKE
ncbi:MAG TPA: DUF4833 domain-containing protein [Hanamia sp.]|jgi:hypothetical protein|nr:DUF4833 domain-containing protein [Hanamia sp.]